MSFQLPVPGFEPYHSWEEKRESEAVSTAMAIAAYYSQQPFKAFFFVKPGDTEWQVLLFKGVVFAGQHADLFELTFARAYCDLD